MASAANPCGVYLGRVWDPEQLAAIEVEIDRLQLVGDPLGEWLAIRTRLDAGPLAPAERALLRRRAVTLREALGPALVLAEDPSLGRPAALRERGLLVDLGFDAATPERLAAVFARPDARFVLRLRLRGDAELLLDCADALLELRRPAWLRLLEFELPSAGELDGKDPDAETEAARLRMRAGLLDRQPALLAAFGELFSVTVDDAPLGFASQPDPTKVRTRIGRALADPDRAGKLRAIELLLDQALSQSELVNQLRVPLIRVVTREHEPQLRQRALRALDQLGPERASVFALLGEWARDHEDSELLAWMSRA